jgi:hypothetical protein
MKRKKRNTGRKEDSERKRNEEDKFMWIYVYVNIINIFHIITLNNPR